MDQGKGTGIWDHPTDKKIDHLIEAGINILKKDTQKASKDFDDYIRNQIGEKEILGWQPWIGFWH